MSGHHHVDQSDAKWLALERLYRLSAVFSLDELLARIRFVRGELDAGRLCDQDVRRYRELGRQVEEMTRRMDAAFDAETAEDVWIAGAQLIRTFLDDYFPKPTVH